VISHTPEPASDMPMGEVVDLDAYRAAQRQRRRDHAKRKERGRPLVERAEATNTKPDAEPVKEDPV